MFELHYRQMNQLFDNGNFGISLNGRFWRIYRQSLRLQTILFLLAIYCIISICLIILAVHYRMLPMETMDFSNILRRTIFDHFSDIGDGRNLVNFSIC